MHARRIAILAAGAAVLAAVVSSQGRGNPNDWPTAYGDAQRTSWIRGDANISTESMTGPGFALQWKTRLESPARQGTSFTQGVVTSGVNLFTPLSTVAGASNVVFALDNDTGNPFWTRRFEGSLAQGTTACPGGISGAPTRIVNLVMPPAVPARGGGRRGGRAYSSAVGEPGAGAPIPQTTGRGGGGRGQPEPSAAVPAPAAAQPAPATATGRGQAAPVTPPVPAPPASPFPTNQAAVAAAGGGGGGLFRSSGMIYSVSGDGMFRALGLVSGRDVQRPAQFLPAGARFSDLIAVAGMVYTATSMGCGGAPGGIWAINVSGDPKSVVSWKTNGGDPIGSPAFTTDGTLIAAIGSGRVAAGGYANAIVALDPKSLAVKDWFTQPGIEFAAPPVVFQESGRNIVAATTRDGRVVLLDAAALGGADHATPLLASAPLTNGRAAFAAQSPALWQERGTAAPSGAAAPAAPAGFDGPRWLVIPVTGPLAAPPDAAANGRVSTGAILAVRVRHEAGTFTVQPGWVSENMSAPLTPIVVNGVVFAASANAPAKLYALNGTTGRTMWQSGDTMPTAVSGRSFWTGSGHVYVGTADGTVYAFGFDMERGSPGWRAGS